MVSLDKFNESCNTLDDLSSKIYVPNKAEDLNLNVFNLITRMSESKILTNIFHAIVNINLKVQNEMQIENGIRNCVDVNAKRQ